MRHTLLAYRQGISDPTTRLENGIFWRATITPTGPATLRLSSLDTNTPVLETYGDGAQWLRERALDMCGARDLIPAITAHHDAVAKAQRIYGSLRLGSSHAAYHELLPAVLGQRVTAIEAHREWKTIVLAHGTPAPGPCEGLVAPPMPDVLASLPYTTFHTYGVERKRADTLRAVAKHADFLFRLTNTTNNPHALTEQLQFIPGVGVWTAAVAGGLAFGDPDALQIGDFHVKNTVAYALTGEIRGTDEEMIRTLSPYEGQRHRVVQWLQMSGARAPARGPRRRIVSITRL